MRFRAFHRLGEDPIVAEASVVIIEADDGTPVAVAQEFANIGGRNGICTVHAGDPQFQRVLQQLGIHQLVVVDRLDDRLVQRPQTLPNICGPG